MSQSIIEVRQTLSELFPEPELRHQIHYFFSYGFIPEYFHLKCYVLLFRFFREESRSPITSPNFLIRSLLSACIDNLVVEPQRPSLLRRAMSLLGLGKRNGEADQAIRVVRAVTDLSMSIRELDGRPCASITMPKPERPGEAHFLCIVLQTRSLQVERWSPKVAARVFVLENLYVGEDSSDTPEGYSGLLSEVKKREGRRPYYGLGRIPLNQDAFLTAVTTLLNDPNVEGPLFPSLTPETR